MIGMQARSEADTTAAEPNSLAAGRVCSFSTAATSGSIPTAATSGPTRLPPIRNAFPPQQAQQQSAASEHAASAPGGMLPPVLGDNSEFADIIIQPSAFAAAAPVGKDLPPAMPPAVAVAAESLPAVASATSPNERARNADVPPAPPAADKQAKVSQHAQHESLPAPERHVQPLPAGGGSVLNPGAELPGKHDGSLRHWIDGQAAPPQQLPPQQSPPQQLAQPPKL